MVLICCSRTRPFCPCPDHNTQSSLRGCASISVSALQVAVYNVEDYKSLVYTAATQDGSIDLQAGFKEAPPTKKPSMSGC